MGDAHHRYEQLAVDHVLGGLASADATAFRTHLVACRDCRRRVAELRDIAEGLEATEREEQVRHELASALGSDVDGGFLGTGGWRRAVIVVVLFALVGLGFWTSSRPANRSRQKASRGSGWPPRSTRAASR